MPNIYERETCINIGLNKIIIILSFFRNSEMFQDFNEYYNKLEETDQIKLDRFFKKLWNKINSSILKKQIRIDYEKAFLYYHDKISLDKSIERLDPDKLWNFYNTAPKLWFPLDTVAKIYPLSMHNKWMAMFRLSFYMDEDVVPELLQIALSTTIKRFPYFSTTIKKWFFWHYLDTIQTRFTIEQEKTYLCETMNISTNSSKLFRVIYRKNRISVEFFHILTDWYGWMEFLKSLAAEYLRLLWNNIWESPLVKDISQAPHADEMKNDYTKAEKQKKVKWYKDEKALKIIGKTGNVIPTWVIHFDFNCNDIKNLSKKFWVSVTALMLWYIIVATAKSTKWNKWNIQVQVPVNMRQFYQSETLANFSLYVLIKIKKESIVDFPSLVHEIQKQLEEKATKETLNEKMCYAEKTAKSIKYLPLFIKKYLVRAIFRFIWNNTISNTLSNIGVIELPEDMKKHIIKADACLWPQVSRKVACTLITCNKTTTLTITKTIKNKEFEKSIMEQLENDGIEFKLHWATQYWK